MFPARSVNDVQSAVERIFPLVYEFRKPRTPADEEILRARRAARRPSPPPPVLVPHAQARDAAPLLTLSDDDADFEHAAQ